MKTKDEVIEHLIKELNNFEHDRKELEIINKCNKTRYLLMERKNEILEKELIKYKNKYGEI